MTGAALIVAVLVIGAGVALTTAPTPEAGGPWSPPLQAPPVLRTPRPVTEWSLVQSWTVSPCAPAPPGCFVNAACGIPVCYCYARCGVLHPLWVDDREIHGRADLLDCGCIRPLPEELTPP